MKTLVSRKAMLSKVIAAAAEYNGAKMGLYKTAISPTPRTLLADITPADFTGYGLSAALTWGVVGQDANDRAVVHSSKIEFAATGSTITNTIYGHYIVTGDGLTLLEVVPFATPIAINEAGDLVESYHTITNPLD